MATRMFCIFQYQIVIAGTGWMVAESMAQEDAAENDSLDDAWGTVSFEFIQFPPNIPESTTLCVECA